MDADLIAASFDELMRAGPKTADYYLCHAIESIDGRLGKGYAAKHPELIAAFLTVAGNDFTEAAKLKVIGRVLDKIGDAIGDIATQIGNR